MLGRWDTIFDRARPDTPYIHGWALAQHAARLGGHVPHQIQRSDLDPARTVEINIADWESPEFARKFTEGILFKWHGRSQRNLIGNIARDVFEAFDRESLARFGQGEIAAATLDTAPAVIIQPFTLLTQEP